MLKSILIALTILIGTLIVSDCAHASWGSFLTGNGVKAHHNHWYTNDGDKAEFDGSSSDSDEHKNDNNSHHRSDRKDHHNAKWYEKHDPRVKKRCTRLHLEYLLRHAFNRPPGSRGLSGCQLWEQDHAYHATAERVRVDGQQADGGLDIFAQVARILP